MNRLKSKIIYQYMITTVALLMLEGYLGWFLLKYTPDISAVMGIDVMLIDIFGALAGLGILAAVSYYFYDKVSRKTGKTAQYYLRQHLPRSEKSHGLCPGLRKGPGGGKCEQSGAAGGVPCHLRQVHPDE